MTTHLPKHSTGQHYNVAHLVVCKQNFKVSRRGALHLFSAAEMLCLLWSCSERLDTVRSQLHLCRCKTAPPATSA